MLNSNTYFILIPQYFMMKMYHLSFITGSTIQPDKFFGTMKNSRTCPQKNHYSQFFTISSEFEAFAHDAHFGQQKCLFCFTRHLSQRFLSETYNLKASTAAANVFLWVFSVRNWRFQLIAFNFSTQNYRLLDPVAFLLNFLSEYTL